MGQTHSNDFADLAQFVRRSEHEAKQLSKKELEEALAEVAKALHKHKEHVTVVAVGGAINTILLHTRESTADIDFFSSEPRLNKELVKSIEDVAKKLHLESDWMNNHTALFIPPGTVSKLFAEAVADDIIIYRDHAHHPALKVVAAPWRYSLVAKLEKAGKQGTGKPYDLDDAVEYLHQLIEKEKHKKPVKRSVLEGWAHEFDLSVTKDKIDELEKRYKAKYHRVGIAD